MSCAAILAGPTDCERATTFAAEKEPKKTGNLRAVQLLLGHTKIESTVRYLGIEVDDALEVAKQIDV